MNLAKLAAKVAFALFVICLSLDIFSYFGEERQPDAVNHAMCSLRPLGLFAWSMFPDGWAAYAADACASFPVEPAISMIAFMVKLSAEMTALVVLTVLLLPVLLESPSSQMEAPVAPNERRQTYFEAVKSYIPMLLIFGVPTILFWLIFRSRAPDDFRTAPLDKIYEDVFLLGVLGCWLMVFCTLAEAALLPIVRWLFPNRT